MIKFVDLWLRQFLFKCSIFRTNAEIYFLFNHTEITNNHGHNILRL